MKKISIIVIIALAIFSLQLIANTPEKRNQLRHSIEQYRDENIYPKMVEWKSQIDKSLTNEELNQLNKLRADFKITKDKFKSKSNELKSDFFKGYKVDKEKMHDLLDSYRDEMKKYGKAVKPLAMNHLESFKKIGEDAKPFKEKWKNDIKKIIEDWKKNNPNTNDKIGKLGMGMMGLEAKEKLMALYMLLWDGSKDSFMNEMEDPNQDFNTQNNEINPYPNPFDKTANIDFTLKSKDKVKITIADKNGNIVATLVDNELSQGFHSLNFNPQDYNLPSGMYVYKIESSSLNKSGKLVLSK